MKSLLCLNAGSSSIKFAVYDIEDDARALRQTRGKIENIGIAPHLVAHSSNGEQLIDKTWDNEENKAQSHEDVLGFLLDWITRSLNGRTLLAIGHRVVHGGTRFSQPEQVTGELLHELDQLITLAPLHQPHNLSAIRACLSLLPAVPQVVSFDTAFHFDMPETATRFAIPYSFHEKGVRRYGFHGLSYEYISKQLRKIDAEAASGRTIVAHLGNGASLCGMLNGKSIDTTMGFTALDGLMMGTRCGNIDPGVVLHLQTAFGMSAKEVEILLYKKSGLLGVSGISSDMRALTQSDKASAKSAIDLFTWRAAREIGALTSSLGGLDNLVFTAGIGENSAEVRAKICDKLKWLGVEIDHTANVRNDLMISDANSKISVRVIPTDEEQMIAEHTLEKLSN